MRSNQRSHRATATTARRDHALTATPLLAGLVIGGAIALAAGQVHGQMGTDDGDLATGTIGVGTDRVEPSGVDTAVGADPNLGADLGVDSAGVGVDAVDGAGIGVLDDRGADLGADIGDPGVTGPGIGERGVTIERDLGVMTKSPNIGGAVTSQGAEVIDDDDLIVGDSQDAATLADDLAEDEDDPIGAAPRPGVAESPLDADGAATTTLD